MALDQFIPILIFQAFIALMFILGLIISRIVSPRNPDPRKTEPFECGEELIGGEEGRAQGQFVMQYYPYILMFLIFDVTSMFLFAWAAAFSTFSLENNIPVIVFIIVLFALLGYALLYSAKKESWK
ncbi:MAG: NADH-quinone oxidoreductase subunit A [Candidatus Sifarchaeia archaeon]|jgi:NADH-quinone oxidoreductase subunit A